MHLLLVPFLSLITLILPFSSAWETTVTLNFNYGGGTWNLAYYTAVAPGDCCISLMPAHSTIVVNQGIFNHLPPGAISAFWGAPPGTDWAQHWHRGCDGRQRAVRYDVPRWEYHAPYGYRNFIHGASYIQCPAKTAPTAQETGTGWLGVLLGFCTRATRRRSVHVQGGEAAREPRRVYPHILEVNGTNYTDGRRGDMVYKDLAGRTLDLQFWT